MEKDTYSYYLIELMKIVNCKVEYYIWIHESMNDASICERRGWYDNRRISCSQKIQEMEV